MLIYRVMFKPADKDTGYSLGSYDSLARATRALKYAMEDWEVTRPQAAASDVVFENKYGARWWLEKERIITGV